MPQIIRPGGSLGVGLTRDIFFLEGPTLEGVWGLFIGIYTRLMERRRGWEIPKLFDSPKNFEGENFGGGIISWLKIWFYGWLN